MKFFHFQMHHHHNPPSLWMKQVWAAAQQNQQNECAPSKDSDQPGRPPSLIRALAVRLRKAWILSYPLSGQRRLWSDWADAQADLSLRRAHMPFCWFCQEAAQIINTIMPLILGQTGKNMSTQIKEQSYQGLYYLQFCLGLLNTSADSKTTLFKF